MIREHDLLDKYDVFVLTRSDHHYAYDHPKFEYNTELDFNRIWVPLGEDYGGLTDRHCVIHKSQVSKYLNLVPFVIRLCHEHPQATRSYNIEQFVRCLLLFNGMYEGVKRFDRIMYTVKTEEDMTTWSVGIFKDPQSDVLIKYPSEFYMTYPQLIV